MPNLLDRVEIKLEWADLARRIHLCPTIGSRYRSPGIHLSGVLRYIAMESGYLVKPGVDSTSAKSAITDVDEDEFPLRMALGMAFEDWMVGLYPEMQWQPGEMERDGVFGTPDGLSAIDIPGRGLDYAFEEFKLTWKSEWNYGKDNFLTHNWLWMNQAKGYLSLAEENGIESRYVRFHIGWVNGDYRPPSPKYVRYLVEFTQAEVKTCWSMIQRNKDKEGVKRES